MRSFENIAQLIRTKRVSHPKGYSQSELSHLLGYKNGQFISNVERALCNIPLKMLRKVSEILSIPTEDLKHAILKDHENTLDIYLSNKNDKVYGLVGGENLDDRNNIRRDDQNANNNPSRSLINQRDK